MAIVLPHVFQDGVNETASGVQVNEDLTVLKNAIEALEAAAATQATARKAQLTLLEPKVGKLVGQPYTPSLTQAALVILTVRAGPSGDAIGRVEVDAAPAFDDFYIVNGRVTVVTFGVKAAGTFKFTAPEGPVNLLNTTYQLLAP